MRGFLEVMFWLTVPFIGIGLLILLWAYVSYLTRDKFPRYYGWSLKAFDYLPKIGAALLIGLVIYAFFTQPSYYDW